MTTAMETTDTTETPKKRTTRKETTRKAKTEAPSESQATVNPETPATAVTETPDTPKVADAGGEPLIVSFNDIFIPEEENVRSDTPKIAELAESIREFGLIEPLVVTRQLGKQPYRLTAGFRRAAALKLLRWGSKSINVVVREEWNPLVNLAENALREGVNPLDSAQRIFDLSQGDYPAPKDAPRRKYTFEEIARATNLSVSSIRTYVRVHEHLCPPVRKAARRRVDVPLHILHSCALLGKYEEVTNPDGHIVREWIANEEKQVKLFDKWRLAKEELEAEGKQRHRSREVCHVDDGRTNRDGYGYRLDKVTSNRARVQILAAIRVLNRQEDEIAKARAEGLRFAVGDLTRLQGVGKEELEQEIKVLREKLKEDA